MIYTDGTHIISDASMQELHSFAQRVGIKRCWFENKRGKRHPHYDKPANIPEHVLISFGAQRVHSRMIADILKNVQYAMLPNNASPICR